MIQMTAIITDDQLTIAAHIMLSRDDIADLHATRDAIELSDLLIWEGHDAFLSLIDDDLIDDDDACILIMDRMRAIMTDMILTDHDS